MRTAGRGPVGHAYTHVPVTREDRVFCEYGLAADQVDSALLIGAKSGRFKAPDPPVPTKDPMPG